MIYFFCRSADRWSEEQPAGVLFSWAGLDPEMKWRIAYLPGAGLQHFANLPLVHPAWLSVQWSLRIAGSNDLRTGKEREHVVYCDCLVLTILWGINGFSHSCSSARCHHHPHHLYASHSSSQSQNVVFPSTACRLPSYPVQTKKTSSNTLHSHQHPQWLRMLPA